MLSKKDCLEIGFKEMPHYTVGDSLTYDLGRNRQLSISCVGTPNETLWITQSDRKDYRKIDDLVCLHNWDYDKYITIDKLKQIISGISKTE